MSASVLWPIDYLLIKMGKSFSQVQRLKLYYYKKKYEKIPTHINISNNSDIVVSLTFIQSRASFLPYTLNALLSQKVKIQKIIVHYANDISPKTVNKLIEDYNVCGVEFRLVRNLGSHKKYIFLTKEERQCRVFLTDDDMILDSNVIGDLLVAGKANKNCISTLFGWEMQLEKGKLTPRKNWKFRLMCSHLPKMSFWVDNAYSLFPSGFFDNDICDVDYVVSKFTNPENGIIGYDDTWLNLNRLRKEISVVYCRPYGKLYLTAELFRPEISLGKECLGNWHEGPVFERLFDCENKNTKLLLKND